MTTKTAFPLEIKSLTDEGFFEGYASVSGNVDLGGDVVAPGAFTKSISATPEVPLLWSHDHAEVIGAIREMKEDGHGLRVKGEIALETSRGKEAYALLKKNMMKGLSIGYQVVSDQIADGKRLLKELNLLEVSVVAVPMNPLATITAVKNAESSASGKAAGTKRMNEETLSQSISELVSEMKSYQKTARQEYADTRQITDATKSTIEGLQSEIKDLTEKLSAVEQKYAAKHAPLATGNTNEGIGYKFVNSDGYKALAKGQVKTTGFVPVGSLYGAKSVTSYDSNGNVISPTYRGPIAEIPQGRKPLIRDFVNVVPVSETGSVEYMKELSFTNNAAVQYDSPNRELVDFAQSDATYTTAQAPIVTIGHWILASRQSVKDVRQLQGLIESRLMSGLKKKEQYEILRGAGGADHLAGICGLATAYNTGYNASGDNLADRILNGITQVTAQGADADAVFTTPEIVLSLMKLKTTGEALAGTYIFSNPAATSTIPTIWGLPLIGVSHMEANKWLTGSFYEGATLYDREEANIIVSTEDGTNVRKSGVTIVAEERIGLAINNSAYFVFGGIS